MRSRRRHIAAASDAQRERARRRRGTGWFLLLCVAGVLLLDAVFGEKGVFATRRARAEEAALSAAVGRLREENARLRDEARRLKQNPSAYEELARQELGLVKPGETLFIVKDVPRASRQGK